MYDITEMYGLPHPGEGPFYTDYLINVVEELPNTSLGAVNWNEALYPHLAAHKDRLVDRFNREYAFREIGQETVTRWMHFLQCRFDEVAEHYNHMYKVYEENNVDEMGTGYTQKEVFDQSKTGTDTGNSSYGYTEGMNQTKNSTENTTNKSSGSETFYDTPNGTVGAINNPTNKTDSDNNSTAETTGNETNNYDKSINRSDNDSRNTSDKTDYTRNITRTVHEEHMIDELNALADKYKSTDNEFIAEFENMFIGVY